MSLRRSPREKNPAFNPRAVPECNKPGKRKSEGGAGLEEVALPRKRTRLGAAPKAGKIWHGQLEGEDKKLLDFGKNEWLLDRAKEALLEKKVRGRMRMRSAGIPPLHPRAQSRLSLCAAQADPAARQGWPGAIGKGGLVVWMTISSRRSGAPSWLWTKPRQAVAG
jgi:hypothetical protein